MRFFAFFMLFGLLTACGGSEKTYTFTPPPTQGGQMCANQCVLANGFCNQSCELDLRSCTAKVQRQALYDYDKYAREERGGNKDTDLSLSDFERMAPCTNGRTACATKCESNYEMCYGSCGGKVVKSGCNFLCF